MSQRQVNTVEQVKQVLTALHDSINEGADSSALYILQFGIELIPNEGINAEQAKTAVRKLKEALASLQDEQPCVYTLSFQGYQESVGKILRIAQDKLTPPEQKAAQPHG